MSAWVPVVCIFVWFLAMLKSLFNYFYKTSGPTEEVEKQRQDHSRLGKINLLLLIVSGVLIYLPPTPTSTHDSSWTWSDSSQISLTFIWGFAAFNQNPFVTTNTSIFTKLNLSININIKHVKLSYLNIFTAMSLLLLQTIMGAALSYRKYVAWELHERYYYYVAQALLIIVGCICYHFVIRSVAVIVVKITQMTQKMIVVSWLCHTLNSRQLHMVIRYWWMLEITT